MDATNKLVLANRFAVTFQKVMREPIQMSFLVKDALLYKEYLRRGLASGDRELVELSRLASQAEGFDLVSSASAVQTTLTPEQWAKLKAAAVDVAGPVGAMLVQKVHAAAPASREQAVEQIALHLGDLSARFQALVKP